MTCFEPGAAAASTQGGDAEGGGGLVDVGVVLAYVLHVLSEVILTFSPTCVAVFFTQCLGC
jgi:hypothetical protein